MGSPLLCVALIAACGEASDLFVAPPTARGGETLIYFFEDGESRFAHVTRGNGPAVVESPWRGSVPDALTITLLQYQEATDELLVSEGPLAADPVRQRSCALLEPQGIQASTIRDRVQSDWVSTELTAELAGFLAPASLGCVPRDPCRTYQRADHALPEEHDVRAGLVTSDGTALVAARRAIYEVTPAGVSEVLSIPRAFAPIYSGAIDVDDVIYLGTEDGEVLRGTLSGGFESFGPAVDDGRVSAIALDPESSDPQLFAVWVVESSTVGHVVVRRHDRGTWTVVYDSDVADNNARQTDLLWRGHNHALLSVARDYLVEIEDRVVDEFEIADIIDLLGFRITSLVAVPGYGELIGSKTGHVFSPASTAEDVWEYDRSYSLAGDVRAMASFQGRLLVGGVRGLVIEVDPVAGACARRELAFADIEFMLPLGDGLVLAGENRLDEPNRVTLLTPE